jgi:hypothetical protein
VDWNNDGRKDLITGERGGQIRIYLNTGTDTAPSFSGYTYLQVGGATFDCGYSSKPDIVDWNNDGLMDVLCGDDYGTVALLLNTGTAGNPVFASSSFVQNGASNLDVGSRASPVSVDWNRDGKKDLIVGDTNGRLYYFQNTGTDENPVFSGYQQLQAGGTTIDVMNYSRPDVADWDNDGVMDLIVGFYYPGAAVQAGVWYYRSVLPVPSLTIDDVGVPEGDTGTTNALFTVTLSSSSGETVTVQYATLAGSATSAEDYTHTSGTLTFDPGEVTKTIIVSIAGDLENEPDETFYIDLSGAINATIADSQGTGTIQNDDQPVTPQLPPYSQDFSSGAPNEAQGWKYYSNNEGRIQVVDGALRLEATGATAAYSLNEAILHVDLLGLCGVTLTLDHTNIGDENDVLPGSFTGHVNGDGIVFSADGINWYKLTDLTSSFTGQSFALDAAARAAGITYTDDVRIKFQQYDDLAAPSDGREFDNITVSALGDTTPFFDEDEYLAMYGDVADAVDQGSLPSGFQHFFSYGMGEGRNPSAFFNNAQYLIKYPDVQAAVDAGAFSSGFHHYVLYGATEGRDPSALFDEGYYLRIYLDVDGAVSGGALRCGFQHYMLYGAGEGRDANSFFSELLYSTRYADVASGIAAGTFRNGLEHFILQGAGEGREVAFNEQEYLGRYPDVEAAVDSGWIASGLQHYLSYGAAEGRNFASLLLESYYLATNADVQAAVAAGTYRCGLEHFIQSGQFQARNATFDEQQYLSMYADVQAAVTAGALASGLEHFLNYGLTEGRNSSPYFVEANYLSSYADVQGAVDAGFFDSGMQHYMLFGQYEGRDPDPGT